MAVSRSGQHLQFRRCILRRFGCGGCCGYALLPGLCRWFCWGISSVLIQHVNLREFRMNQRGYPLLFWWGEQRLESMRAATVVLTRSAGLSLSRLVMVHYRIVVHFCHFNSFFFTPLSPPISPAYRLLVHCVLCMDALASTPPPQHKYTHLPKYNIFFCKCV